MSLGRLLSAARALTKLGESPSPYRVRAGALLPKFGDAHDPFAAERKVNLGGSASAEAGASAGDGSVRGSLWPWPRPGAKKEQLPAPARPTGKSEASRPVRALSAPVQCELRLEHVQVVRNDLRDADLAVVARAGDAAAGRSGVTSNLLLGAMAAEKALDRLADRIVGAGAR